MGRGRPSKKTASFVRTGRPKGEKTVICVVYKKPNGKKHFLNTYVNFELDSIISNRKHTPLISDDYEIVEDEETGEFYFYDEHLNLYIYDEDDDAWYLEV